MKDRITQLLASEGISPAEFADKIGVQRSSISHVLNGRNYPSASFIQKILVSYKTLSPRWLLLGEGSMFEAKPGPVKEPLLFEFPGSQESVKTGAGPAKSMDSSLKASSDQSFNTLSVTPDSTIPPNQPADLNLSHSMPNLSSYISDSKDVDRIVFFFTDKTFAVYTPSK
ncbi:MAG: helix-turn-helix transcriptional regulator [Mariniphaga sp.]